MLTAASSILLVYVVVLYSFAAVGSAAFGGTAKARADFLRGVIRGQNPEVVVRTAETGTEGRKISLMTP